MPFRPCTMVYASLILLTMVTWAVGHWGPGGQQLALLVLGLALVKGQLVGDWFMGLRRVSGIWRWVVAIWLFIPGGLVATAFILGYRG